MAGQASVIIPAHEEEDSLPGTLRTLLAGIPEDELEVVVVANGCSDRTADAAREVSLELDADVRVEEVARAAKTLALNVGDTVATAFPRVYLDADVHCPAATVRSMVAALQGDRWELAVPTRRLDLGSATWWVRHYYDAWQVLPRVLAELSGRGAYALSRAGRERFDRFPPITADDFWAVRQVPSDRAVVVPEEIVIRPPSELRSLVRVRSRIYAANRAAHVSPNRRSSGSADVRFLLRNPRLWVAAGVFLGTNAYVKVIGVRRRSGYGRDAARGVRGPARATAARESADRADDRAV